MEFQFWVRGSFPEVGVIEEGRRLDYLTVKEIERDLKRRGLIVEIGIETRDVLPTRQVAL